MKRLLFWICCMLALFQGIVSAHAENLYPIRGYLAGTDTAPLYARSDTQSDQLAVIGKEDTFSVVSNVPYTDGSSYFVDVEYQGQRGYVRINCVDVILPEAMARPRTLTTIQSKNPSDDLLLRAGPGSNYVVVGYLFGGDLLDYSGEKSGNWYHVSSHGLDCWISSKYVQVTTWSESDLYVPPEPVPEPSPEPAPAPEASPEPVSAPEPAPEPTPEPAPAPAESASPEPGFGQTPDLSVPGPGYDTPENLVSACLEALGRKDEQAVLSMIRHPSADVNDPYIVHQMCEESESPVVISEFISPEICFDRANGPAYDLVLRMKQEDADEARDIAAIVRSEEQEQVFSLLCVRYGNRWYIGDLLSAAAVMAGLHYNSLGFAPYIP